MPSPHLIPVAAAVFTLTLILMGVSYRYIRQIARLKNRVQALTNRSEKITESANKFIIDRLVDLRRPLHGLVGIHDLYLNNDSPFEPKEYLEIVDYCSRFLIRQLERIQFFTELERETLRFDSAKFNLRKCIEKSIADAQEQANSKKSPITQVWSDGLPETVEGSELALNKILLELLDNAIRHAGQNIIEVRICPDPDNSELYRIAVCDSGPGLSTKQIHRINTPVSRIIKRRPWANTEGGVGIPLVKKILAQLSGQMSVETRKGLGTSISFVLPQNILHACFQEQKPETLKHAPSVLLVDDEPIALHIMSGMLTKLGLATSTAENGLVAVQMCQKNKYDLIFMDLDMPVMSGYDAIRIISQELSLTYQPSIIVASANCRQEDRDRCEALGAVGFLAKPIRQDDMRSCLQNLGYTLTDVRDNQQRNNVIDMSAERDKRKTKHPQEPGYLVDFNKLYNSLNEDLQKCHLVLLSARDSLDTQLEAIAMALENNDDNELMTLLANIKSEMAQIMSNPGIEVIEKMEDAARVNNDESLQIAFDDLSEVFENMVTEIEGLINTKTLAS